MFYEKLQELAKSTGKSFNQIENDLNYSKNTLFRRFITPENAFSLPIEIIEDPYTLLLELFEDNSNG